jgi:hypothetical protein
VVYDVSVQLKQGLKVILLRVSSRGGGEACMNLDNVVKEQGAPN